MPLKSGIQEDDSKGGDSLAIYQCAIGRQIQESHFAKVCVESMAFLLLLPLDIWMYFISL